MTVINVHFDGEKIEIPDELRRIGPCDAVLHVRDVRDLLVRDMPKRAGSWRDVVGMVKNPLNADQLRERLDELRRDRDEWDND